MAERKDHADRPGPRGGADESADRQPTPRDRPVPGEETLREAVQRRMRELDESADEPSGGDPAAGGPEQAGSAEPPD
ncbi:hypothetical protein ACFWXK_25475 [Streptomyces sp. NPDC059070]|uniref:hypothetical protein n=1 Tax=Streptomyces sp. NPDC059070 TaxID=3346713 RepID=UPI0036CD876A